MTVAACIIAYAMLGATYCCLVRWLSPRRWAIDHELSAGDIWLASTVCQLVTFLIWPLYVIHVSYVVLFKPPRWM